MRRRRHTPFPRTRTPVLLALILALAAAAAWPRLSGAWALRAPHADATFSVAQLTALLQARYNAVRGRVIAVQGYYHHACPYCTWDAPPSLTVGPSWGGPSIVVSLPDSASPGDEPAWIAHWRALPIVGRLAPQPPTGPPEGFTTFTGIISPICTQATICDGPPYVIHVLPRQ